MVLVDVVLATQVVRNDRVHIRQRQRRILLGEFLRHIDTEDPPLRAVQITSGDSIARGADDAPARTLAGPRSGRYGRSVASRLPETSGYFSGWVIDST